MVDNGIEEDIRNHLVHFAIRVGARHAADAATCLAQISQTRAAAIVDRQARLIGSLQYPLVIEEDARAAVLLRNLVPTYDELLEALPR